MKIKNSTKKSYRVVFGQPYCEMDLAKYSKMMKAGKNTVPQRYMDANAPMIKDVGQK